METLSSHQQTASEGFGALFHRVYYIEFDSSFESAQGALEKLKVQINEFSPQILARFEKLGGSPNELNPGDEFQIHITGPWNGPVRVSSVKPHSFCFVTLEGHLEAGEIHFRIKKVSEKRSRFEIESIARSRDAIVDLVYDKVPVARLAQTEMWTCFCESFAETALRDEGVNPDDEPEKSSDVQIITERRDEKTGEWVKI